LVCGGCGKVRAVGGGGGGGWSGEVEGPTLEAGFDKVERVDDDGGPDTGCEACDRFDEGGWEKGGFAHDLALMAGGGGGEVGEVSNLHVYMNY
jgi:hypothetical protein